MKPTGCYLLIVASIAYAGCVTADEALGLSSKSIDISPPMIDHKPLTEPILIGAPGTISARITDDSSGIKNASLYFRPMGEDEYKKVEMTSKDGTTYTGEIPERYVQKPGIEYFIEAVDNSENKILRGFNISPLTIRVTSGAPWQLDDIRRTETAPGAEATVDSTTQTPQQVFRSSLTEENGSGKRKNLLMWIVGGVAGSVVLCYSSCSCGKPKSQCESESTGTISVETPNP